MKRLMTDDDRLHAACTALADATPGGAWDCFWAGPGTPQVVATTASLSQMDKLLRGESFVSSGAPVVVPDGVLRSHDPMSLRRWQDINGQSAIVVRRRLP